MATRSELRAARPRYISIARVHACPRIMRARDVRPAYGHRYGAAYEFMRPAGRRTDPRHRIQEVQSMKTGRYPNVKSEHPTSMSARLGPKHLTMIETMGAELEAKYGSKVSKTEVLKFCVEYCYLVDGKHHPIAEPRRAISIEPGMFNANVPAPPKKKRPTSVQKKPAQANRPAHVAKPTTMTPRQGVPVKTTAQIQASKAAKTLPATTKNSVQKLSATAKPQAAPIKSAIARKPGIKLLNRRQR